MQGSHKSSASGKWLFHAQSEGAFDRKDNLGLLFAVARDLLGRVVSMDIPLISVFLLMESFIMLSKLKSVLSRYVDTSKNPPKQKKANFSRALAKA